MVYTAQKLALEAIVTELGLADPGRDLEAWTGGKRRSRWLSDWDLPDGAPCVIKQGSFSYWITGERSLPKVRTKTYCVDDVTCLAVFVGLERLIVNWFGGTRAVSKSTYDFEGSRGRPQPLLVAMPEALRGCRSGGSRLHVARLRRGPCRAILASKLVLAFSPTSLLFMRRWTNSAQSGTA